LTIAIREATREDYSRLIEIMSNSADREELKGFVPPRSATKKFLLQLRRHLKLSGHEVLVAEMDRVLVGFIYFIREENCFAIEELDVVKRHQREGIGKVLVENVEKLARDSGVDSLTTGTAINSEGMPWKAYSF
jgi:GNAT superfamily N-acetyltransferase